GVIARREQGIAEALSKIPCHADRSPSSPHSLASPSGLQRAAALGRRPLLPCPAKRCGAARPRAPGCGFAVAPPHLLPLVRPCLAPPRHRAPGTAAGRRFRLRRRLCVHAGRRIGLLALEPRRSLLLAAGGVRRPLRAAAGPQAPAPAPSGRRGGGRPGAPAFPDSRL